MSGPRRRRLEPRSAHAARETLDGALDGMETLKPDGSRAPVPGEPAGRAPASSGVEAAGAVAEPPRPHTLAVDIGASGIKAAVLDAGGRRIAGRVRVATPHPAPPGVLVDTVLRLVGSLPDYDRVSVGFPGVVRAGRILTATNLDAPEAWRGFDLAGALAAGLGRPVRILNDAEVQGLGVIEGRGLEMVLTLGTGFGSALFLDGVPAPHLELAHHPFRKGQTYEEQLGNEALKRVGRKTWNRRLERAIATLRVLVNFDRLYLGGGNARKIELEPSADTTVVSNKAGVLGGIALWREPSESLPPRQAEALEPDAEGAR